MQKIKLHDYQEYAKNFILTRPSCALWLDMGLGKTLTTLETLYTINPKSHTLIIAPKTIAKSVWQDEIDKWGYPFRTKSLIVDDKGRQLNKKARLQLIKSIPEMKPTIFFINRELITKLIEESPIINGHPRWCFPIVIIDEAQSFKSHKSTRFKALQKVRPAINHIIELSGTPAPNGLMDIWSQIWLLDQGERLGKNITTYRNTYFNPGLHMHGYPVKWDLKNGAEEMIYDKINDIAISMKNTSIKLPPCTIKDIYVHLNQDEKNIYRKLKKQIVIDTQGNEVTPSNAGVLYNRLSQMASGSLYVDEDKNYVVIHKQKLELTKYIIQNTQSPILVGYHFVNEAEMILEYFKDETDIEVHLFDGSPEMIKSWNDSKLQVLLIHPASAGHGLNLQYGGCHMIWYTLPESLEEYLQAMKRLHRQGQVNPVIVTRLLTKDTIDEKKIINLENKEGVQTSLLDAVKATMNDGL